LDPTSGHTFYTNRRTGETSWKRPAEEEMVVGKEEVGVADGGREKDGEKDDEKGDRENAASEMAAADGAPPVSWDEDEGLDVGWQKRMDPSSGRPFYVNKATGESTWVKPQRQQAEGGEADGEKENDAPSAGHQESEWLEKRDAKTGRVYYINKKDKKSQWSKPAAFKSNASGSSNDNAAEEAPVGADSGAPTIPAPRDADGTDGTSEKKAPSARGQRRKSVSIGGGWNTKFDPSSGKYYYFNRKTGETQWKKPAGLEGLDPAAAQAGGGGGGGGGGGRGDVKTPATNGRGASRPGGGGSSLAAAAKVARRASLTRGSLAGAASVGRQPQASAPTAQWVERPDPASGRSFWFNKKTGETQWKKPT
jgi:hypothetical protein